MNAPTPDVVGTRAELKSNVSVPGDGQRANVRKRAYSFSRALSKLLGRGRTRTPGSTKVTRKQPPNAGALLVELSETLLSRRGDSSGVHLAQRLMVDYFASDVAGRLYFLRSLANHFGPDIQRVKASAESFLLACGPQAAQDLHMAAEPRRQELFRRLNLAPAGTLALIRMREQLLSYIANYEELKAVDADMHHLFTAWFNRGFLSVRAIDWKTPAHILEKLIKYEAVHQIKDWQDLRRRTEPLDRRCFAFFHPCLPDEPLIFVEVALTREIPTGIAPLLTAERAPVEPGRATTAVFYSISNCQVGLKGISFGHFLIKQVAEELRKELPGVRRFVTLSPVPGFAAWLDKELRAPTTSMLSNADTEKLGMLNGDDWHANPESRAILEQPLLRAAACYFLSVRGKNGRPLDPVARFHLGNGAKLERLNVFGDTSLKGLKQSKGLMVNYLYDLQKVEANHEYFASTGNVVASPSVRRVLGRAEHA